MIELGMKVKDEITGFTGIAVARAIWLYGCARIAIQEQAVDEKGDPKTEAYWFDEPQVRTVGKKNMFKDEKSKKIKKPGGPMSSTPKRRGGDPQR